jgi:CheY-like chemotaxis protein
LEVEKIPFSLSTVMEELQAQFRLKAQEKSIELRFEFSGLGDGQVVTDPTRLKQILINIIGNAIKFTESGYVEVVAKKTAGRRVEFIIRDTGIGIDHEHMRRLFQPFMQADGSTTRRFGGAGLGLALSRTLARVLGGDLVLLDSKPGAGTRFRVTIDSGAPVETPTANAGAGTTEWQDSLKDVSVLLVEDAADNRMLARRLLEFAGAKVDLADDGLQGLEKALARPYDVVLMDLQMPGIDGFEATV